MTNFFKEYGNLLKEQLFIVKHDMQGIFFLFLACCFLSGMLSCTDDQGQVDGQATATAQLVQSINKSELIAGAGLSYEQIRSYLHYYSPIIFKQANEYDDDHRIRTGTMVSASLFCP